MSRKLDPMPVPLLGILVVGLGLWLGFSIISIKRYCDPSDQAFALSTLAFFAVALAGVFYFGIPWIRSRQLPNWIPIGGLIIGHVLMFSFSPSETLLSCPTKSIDLGGVAVGCGAIVGNASIIYLWGRWRLMILGLLLAMITSSLIVMPLVS